MNILIVNGPNLNMLEYRDHSVYGDINLKTIEARMRLEYTGINFHFFQSNHEGDIIDKIHTAIVDKYDGIIINPGALSHYSYSIYDALEMFRNKVVEVHLSDVTNREEFRKNLVTAKAADKVISGLGAEGYLLAVEYIKNNINS